MRGELPACQRGPGHRDGSQGCKEVTSTHNRIVPDGPVVPTCRSRFALLRGLHEVHVRLEPLFQFPHETLVEVQERHMLRDKDEETHLQSACSTKSRAVPSELADLAQAEYPIEGFGAPVRSRDEDRVPDGFMCSSPKRKTTHCLSRPPFQDAPARTQLEATS